MRPAFENSKPVSAVDFQYETVSLDDERRIRQETIIRMIQMLAAGSKEQSGARVQLIGFMLGVSECRTQSELARKLRVSRGRVSQALNTLRKKIAHFTDTEKAKLNLKLNIEP